MNYKREVFREFTEWLKENSDRLRHVPILFKKVRIYKLSQLRYMYIFREITTELELLLSCDGGYANLEVWAGGRTKSCDILLDLDIKVGRSDSGDYYCSMCEKPRMFPALRSLLEYHLFDPMVEWCDENFIESNMLFLCSYGSVIESGENPNLKRFPGECIRMVPVINPK